MNAWFGAKPWGNCCNSLKRVATPTGQLCLHCEEAIQENDDGIMAVMKKTHQVILKDNLLFLPLIILWWRKMPKREQTKIAEKLILKTIKAQNYGWEKFAQRLSAIHPIDPIVYLAWLNGFDAGCKFEFNNEIILSDGELLDLAIEN